MIEDQLKKLKIALGIKDDSYDDLLNLYLEDAEDFLKLRLSLKDSEELPTVMLAIMRGAAVKKFNRFKNEGFSAYSQEGESITFNATDLDEWSDEIAQWRNDNQKNLSQGSRGKWVDPYAL